MEDDDIAHSHGSPFPDRGQDLSGLIRRRHRLALDLDAANKVRQHADHVSER